jgi:hypothetical protein
MNFEVEAQECCLLNSLVQETLKVEVVRLFEEEQDEMVMRNHLTIELES